MKIAMLRRCSAFLQASASAFPKGRFTNCQAQVKAAGLPRPEHFSTGLEWLLARPWDVRWTGYGGGFQCVSWLHWLYACTTEKMVWRKLVRLVRSLSDVSVAPRLDTLVALFQGQRMTGLLEKHSAVAMRPYPPSDRAVCSWGSILALLASAERMLTIVTKCHKVTGISCWPKLCIGSMEPSI